MSEPLIILIAVFGAILLVLSLAFVLGYGDRVKGFFSFILGPLGALLAVLGGIFGAKRDNKAMEEIRKENDRIKLELEQLREERKQIMAGHEKEKADFLSQKARYEQLMAQNEAERNALKDRIEKNSKMNAQEWLKSLPELERNRILKEINDRIKWED